MSYKYKNYVYVQVSKYKQKSLFLSKQFYILFLFLKIFSLLLVLIWTNKFMTMSVKYWKDHMFHYFIYRNKRNFLTRPSHGRGTDHTGQVEFSHG